MSLYLGHKKNWVDGELARKPYISGVQVKNPDPDADLELPENRVLSFSITTMDEDRDGDIVNPMGMALDNFIKNPVVLFAHDNRQPPIARAFNLEKTSQQILSDAEFTTREVNPLGDTVFRLFKGGFMHAVSVGFRIVNYSISEDRAQRGLFPPLDIHESELFEFSPVPVPSNPNALVAARSAGIDMLPALKWAQKLLDLGASDESLPGIAHRVLAPAQFQAVDVVEEVIKELSDRDLLVKNPEITPRHKNLLASAKGQIDRVLNECNVKGPESEDSESDDVTQDPSDDEEKFIVIL